MSGALAGQENLCFRKLLWWPEQSRGDQTRAGRPGPDFLRTLVVVGRAKDI